MMIAAELPQWEARLAYVLRALRAEGYARASGKLPHQWTTKTGTLRCAACGEVKHTAHVGAPAPLFVYACPRHAVLVHTRVVTLTSAFLLPPPTP